MLDYKDKIIESSLQGDRVFLSIPDLSDMQYFLDAVNESTELHQPWVEPPHSEGLYHKYLQRINFKTHIGFLVKETRSRQIVGVFNISEIVEGVFQSGYLGFYAMKRFSDQGLMSEALSLTLRLYFQVLGLHRLEANIQPGNEKSKNLVQGKGFRLEGFSPKYLKINNQWQDHERYAITVEDYTEDV